MTGPTMTGPAMTGHATTGVPLTGSPTTGAPTTGAPMADAPMADVPMADVPMADVPESGSMDPDAERTMAVARFGAGAEASAGPPLMPDAILPPGTPPQAPPDPAHDPGATSTGPIPRLGPGRWFPGGPGMPPPSGPAGRGHRGPSGARRALLAGGGLLGVLLVGGGGVLAYTTLSGGSPKHHEVGRSAAPAPPAAQPTPPPSKTKPKPKRKPKPPPIDIRDEKKDPKPLTISEVFPSRRLNLAGHTFVVAKTVINDHCDLAANGPFAVELTRQHCRRVVRATYVSGDKKLAVTTGIAVMPTDAAAAAALKTQDAAHYEWFRGMKATGAPKIDHAGGYAVSALRGRYISYAYATYADGHKPAANDQALKGAGNAFRDSTARPIDRRAKD
jgi:hypothetical protein